MYLSTPYYWISLLTAFSYTRMHLDLYPEPECHDTVSVDLTPEVEHGENERGAENHQAKEQRNDHQTDRVEDQHEEIVGRLTTEITWE